MAYTNSVIKANHFVVVLLPSAKDGFLQAVRNLGPSEKISRTLTESNITGLESINFTTAYENIVLRNNFSPEYICDLNNEFQLIISGKYSNCMVNLPFTITNKKEQWSLSCKINFTLHLSQLNQNGLYIVLSIPLYGIQIVINYNCITKDITIKFRLPIFDGNDEDRNAASSNGCNLKCLYVDFVKNKIDQKTFEKPVSNPHPYLPPNPRDIYIPAKNDYVVRQPPTPPPRDPKGSLANPLTSNNDRSVVQRLPTYSNTPVTSPPIPPRPLQQLPQRSASSSSYCSYSAQSSYNIQAGFGVQANSSQYNTLPKIPARPRQISPPPPYSNSNSAPCTPSVQPVVNTTNPNSTPTRTEPVRKGFDQLNVSVNKAMNGIDKFINKASNAVSSFKKENPNNNPQQQSQQSVAVKTI